MYKRQGDGNALTLAAGKLAAVLTDVGVPAVGELFCEPVHIGCLLYTSLFVQLDGRPLGAGTHFNIYAVNKYVRRGFISLDEYLLRDRDPHHYYGAAPKA